MNRYFASIAAWMLLLCVSAAAAQDSRSYDEGPVTVVSSIRVKDGQWDNYMAYLAGPYRTVFEAQKKSGLVLSYGIYSVSPRAPGDPNMYLTVTYPNMATLDGYEDKFDPIAREALGESRADGEKRYAERSTMRDVLGSEMIRELKLR